MDKFFGKKNLGIPATLFVLMAYFIGYNIADNFSGLLVAVLFAVLVFAFDFDEKVRIAVKQSYMLGFLLGLIYFALDILSQFVNMITPSDYGNTYALFNIFNSLYRVVNSLFSIFVIVVFALFILAALVKKDIRINFLLELLEDGAFKQTKATPMYQQPVPPMQQLIPPVTQPVRPVTQPIPPTTQPVGPVAQPISPTTQPVEPVTQTVPPVSVTVTPVTQQENTQTVKKNTCANCGAGNREGAAYCTSCGSKLS